MIFDRKYFKYWKNIERDTWFVLYEYSSPGIITFVQSELEFCKKRYILYLQHQLLAYQVWFRLYSSIKQSVFKNRNQASNFPSELKESFSRSKLLLLELRRWRASMKLNMLSKIWRIMINIQISQYSTYWAVPSLFSAMQE